MSASTLLQLLADGEFRSGQDLAAALGVSRTAVWKQLNKAGAEFGLTVESVKGLGYRIPGGLDLLDATIVRHSMDARSRSLLADLKIFQVVDSTNSEIMRRIAQGASAGLVCTAEQQTAGRGRRGRSWVSPFACNLYVSVTWQYEQGVAALEGLSLAVGVAVARALEDTAVADVQLKWPNDLLHAGAKLGGILVEMVGDAAGPCQVVVGIGLNVAMSQRAAMEIDQDWTDVASIVQPPPGRSELLGAILTQLLPQLAEFEQRGFAHWHKAWENRDAYRGQSVVLQSGEKKLAGIARGVNERGALMLETATGVQPIYGGEMSVRRAS